MKKLLIALLCVVLVLSFTSCELILGNGSDSNTGSPNDNNSNTDVTDDNNDANDGNGENESNNNTGNGSGDNNTNDNTGSGSGDDNTDDNTGNGSGDNNTDDNTGNGSGDNGADDNTDTPLISTTVADENEWYDVFAIDNFSYYEVANQGKYLLFEVASFYDTGKYASKLLTSSYSDYSYGIRIGGMWYGINMTYSTSLSEKNVGVIGKHSSSEIVEYEDVAAYNLPLEAMFENQDIKGAFSKATYDENKKAYLYSYSEVIEVTYSYSYEFYIVNKQIAKIHCESSIDDFEVTYDYEFYNIGTTAIDSIPSVVFVGIPESIYDNSHNWVLNEGSIVSAQGCEGIGTASFVCSNCQETLTCSYINGHSFYTEYRNDEGSSGCADGVYKIEKCKTCNEVIQEMYIGNLHIFSYEYCDLSGYNACEDHEISVMSCSACGVMQDFYLDEKTYYGGAGDYSCDKCELRTESTVIKTEMSGSQEITTVKISVYYQNERIVDYTTEEQRFVFVVKYTVEFRDYDGTLLKTEFVEKGKGAVAPDAPERDGYTFVGWDKAFDNVTQNITVTALYEANPPTYECTSHTDVNNDEKCDDCGITVVIILDIFALNDLHGKFDDSDSGEGVDELSTYLENQYATNDATILLSSGDMWQGSAESNLTKGNIITDWMNRMGFVSMTVGNHEFDWGYDYITQNGDIAEFPILAINIYDVATGKRADFCQPSVIVERNGVKIGIIGAIGDVKSSISASLVTSFEFKTGNDLTELVMAESNRLRDLGCEFIIYSIHGGSGSAPSSLSNGYVDVVFEGHSHSEYVTVDSYGVYHLQNGGYDNGISHVEIKLNFANDTVVVQVAEIVTSSQYSHLDDHPIVDELLEKYKDQITQANEELGYNSSYRNSSFITQLAADLYLEKGLEKWSSKYQIVLGGGYLNTRDPYSLSAGTVLYSDLLSLLPFDNDIYLCSISGSDLLNQFINNSKYTLAYSEYGNSVKNSINRNATYYVIVDSYTVDYAPNNLTPIECLTPGVYARDLIAEYCKAGGLDSSGNSGGSSGGNNSGNTDSSYKTLTIEEAIALGEAMSHNTFTTEMYYIEGEIMRIESTKYGNMYIMDEYGNSIYIYGLYDESGKRYDSMSNAPKVGDTIRVLSIVGCYDYMAELKHATLVEII